MTDKERPTCTSFGAANIVLSIERKIFMGNETDFNYFNWIMTSNSSIINKNVLWAKEKASILHNNYGYIIKNKDFANANVVYKKINNKDVFIYLTRYGNELIIKKETRFDFVDIKLTMKNEEFSTRYLFILGKWDTRIQKEAEQEELEYMKRMKEKRTLSLIRTGRNNAGRMKMKMKL